MIVSHYLHFESVCLCVRAWERDCEKDPVYDVYEVHTYCTYIGT